MFKEVEAVYVGVGMIAMATVFEVVVLLGAVGNISEPVHVVLGFAGAFLIVTALAFLPAWRVGRNPRRVAKRAAVLWTVIGLGAPIWLFVGAFPLIAALPAGLLVGVTVIATA